MAAEEATRRAVGVGVPASALRFMLRTPLGVRGVADAETEPDGVDAAVREPSPSLLPANASLGDVPLLTALVIALAASL